VGVYFQDPRSKARTEKIGTNKPQKRKKKKRRNKRNNKHDENF